MKTRDQRALIAKVKTLLEADDAASARALIEGAEGALHIPRMRNTYAGVLRALGDGEGFERVLAATLRLEPGNRYAVNAFLGFDKGQVKPMSAADVYANDFAHPAYGGIFLARAAAVALGRRDFERAWDYSIRSIDAPQDSEVRRLVRLALASLIFWHGRLDLAERLVMRGRTGGEMFDALWDRVQVRKTAAYDEITLALFKFLTVNKNKHRHSALVAYFDYLWATQGASQALLDESESWAALTAADDVGLRSQQIALAYELGRHDFATRLLIQAPACAALYKQVLPIAKLLVDEPRLLRDAALGFDPGEVSAASALYDDIVAGSDMVRRRFGDDKTRVAIVGNSPCESGKLSGGAIDRHDLVVRFNKAPSGGKFNDDYGSRTDVHALPHRGNAEAPPIADAEFVLFTNSHILARNRDWLHAKSLRRRGKIVGCIPGNNFARLVQQLEAPPSAGLRVCAYVQSQRGPLPRGSLFGFGFTDQIGPNPSSSHYFGHAVPSMHHNWAKELAVFQSLLEPRSGSA